MFLLWLALLVGGCASFTPDPGDPLARDMATPAAIDGGAGPDLRSVPDLSAPDLTPPPPDFAGLDIYALYSYPRVNEVVPAAGGLNAEEFIELLGGSVDTPLKDYKLNYQASTGGVTTLVTFGELTLPKGGYLLIAASGSRFAAMADVQFNAGPSGRLARDVGAVGLLNPTGARLDSLAWGTTMVSYVEGRAAQAPGDQGLSRFPDGIDTDQNNVDAHAAEPTPKAANK